VQLEPQRSVVRRTPLRSGPLGPALRQQFAQEHSEAHWRLLRWVQMAARQQLEQQYSVALSLRSVRSEPALRQQLALEHLEAHWRLLRWVQLEMAARQQLEQQY
jgi:hypothetical protein